MDQDNDAAYYRQREATARSLADASSDPSIKRIHLQMADNYAEKAAQLTSRPTLRMFPSGG